jgi:uncharacterized repeat protein (TIGR01451 family)
VKRIIWLSLLSLILPAVVPLRADTDGRFLGRAIQFDGKRKPETLPPVAQPPPRPLPLPEPRPAPPAPPAPAISLPTPPPMDNRNCGCVRLLKQMPAEAAYGQEFAYQLTVFAGENVADVLVRDLVPDGAVFVRSEPPARVTGNLLEWTWTEMDAGQTKEIRIWIRPEREGRIGSCATVSAVPRACAFTTVSRATLAITKTGPATAIVGEDIPYNITVSNSGNAIARQVVVTDNVPDGLAHSTGQSILTLDIGDLGPNQSRTLPVVLKAVRRGRVCNTASATSPNAGRVTAEACTAIVQPGLQVTKSGPAEQFIGKTADYTITVINVGDTPLNNVTVTDTAPQVTRILNASGATIAGTQAQWVLPQLAPGERRSLSLTLTTATAGTHANTVAAAAAGLTANAQAATLWRGLGAMLVEVVDSPDPILIGGTTTYTIRVTNQGSADLVNVNTVGTFPREVTPTAAQNGTISGSTVRFQTIPRIGVGQSATFTVTGRGAVEGDGRVKFSFTEDSLGSPVIEEESTRVF